MSRKILVSLLFIGSLILATPAFAQEGQPATQNSSPAGIGILILLIGLAAIGIVGASVVFRRAPSAAGASGSDEGDSLIEDDELQ